MQGFFFRISISQSTYLFYFSLYVVSLPIVIINHQKNDLYNRVLRLFEELIFDKSEKNFPPKAQENHF